MSTITIRQLRTLINQAARPDLRTVEALLYDVCDGNRQSSQMLHQLFWWWGSSDVVYKSHKDWHAELRLSRSQVDRAVKHLSNVVTMTVRKAYGTPTRHFQLDIPAFISRVATVLGMTVEAVQAGLFAPYEPVSKSNKSKTPSINKPAHVDESVQTNASESCNEMPQNDAMDCTVMTQSITTTISNNKNNNNKQQQAIPTGLNQLQVTQPAAAAENFDPDIVKIFGGSASHLIQQYGQNRVLEVLANATSRPEINNPAGFARHVLATGGTLKPIAPPPTDYDDPMRFVRGEFADFIDH